MNPCPGGLPKRRPTTRVESSAVAHQHESRPVKRMAGLRVLHHLQRRLPQGFGLRHFRFRAPRRSQLAMKTEHQIARAGRFDFPLADHGRRRAGDEQRPASTRSCLRPRRIARAPFRRRRAQPGRLSNPVCINSQASSNPSSFLSPWASARWEYIGEALFKIPCVAKWRILACRGFGLEAIFTRLGADIDLATRRCRTTGRAP